MLSAVLVAAAALSTCNPISGVAALWASPRTHFIFVGEGHGTVQDPKIFTDLVCQAAAAKKPIVVAIEHSTAEQTALDEFIGSDGGEDARRTYLAFDDWRYPEQDGRWSVAYFEMIEDMRQLVHAGTVERVVAVKGNPNAPITGEGPNDAANRGIVDWLTPIRAAEPDALILVYVGAVHAEKARVRFGDITFLPAAALLPSDETVSLQIKSEGGEAWDCRGTSCGMHQYARPIVAHSRGVILGPGVAENFDGVLYTGLAATPSPPAVPFPTLAPPFNQPKK